MLKAGDRVVLCIPRQFEALHRALNGKAATVISQGMYAPPHNPEHHYINVNLAGPKEPIDYILLERTWVARRDV